MTGVIYSTVRETAIDRRDNGQKLSITGVLKILGLSKSGYYNFVQRLGRPEKDEVLAEKITPPTGYVFSDLQIL